jgi:dimethylglycine dehydrogenase
MESLRLEKSYRMCGSDLGIEYTPLEASLDRFVRWNKGDFIGKAALEAQKAAGVPKQFATIEVHGVTDADPLGNEPLYVNGQMVGRATAGYYGHCLQKSLALGYIDTAHSAVGTALEILILGEMKKATIVIESPLDPENAKLRA